MEAMATLEAEEEEEIQQIRIFESGKYTANC
jgi:hypothetical protein